MSLVVSPSTSYICRQDPCAVTRLHSPSSAVVVMLAQTANSAPDVPLNADNTHGWTGRVDGLEDDLDIGIVQTELFLGVLLLEFVGVLVCPRCARLVPPLATQQRRRELGRLWRQICAYLERKDPDLPFSEDAPSPPCDDGIPWQDGQV